MRRGFADPLAQAEVDRLTAKLAVLEAGQPLVSEALRDEIQRLSAKLEQVEALHFRNPKGPWCYGCARSWPCSTRAVLDEETE